MQGTELLSSSNLHAQNENSSFRRIRVLVWHGKSGTKRVSQSCRNSGNWNKTMRILSANDDFCSRTLAAVDGGSVRKFSYISGLRDLDGVYRHWGLQRTHGPDASNDAIAKHHVEAWLELLRAPLPELVAELEMMDAAERDELLAMLSAGALPAQPSGGSGRHFNSTVLALRLVFQPKNGLRAA